MSYQSPCFYFNEKKIIDSVENYQVDKKRFRLNYSVKSCLFDRLVKVLDSQDEIDGFTVSSIQELLDTRAETKKPIHFVSPLIRAEEIKMINNHANSVSFNSTGQAYRFKPLLRTGIITYFRINPEISIVDDERYDPCRKYSKLGIPLKELNEYINESNLPDSPLGLHFHTACQEKDASHVLKIIDKIKCILGPNYKLFEYLNIGGGYIASQENLRIFNELYEKDQKFITIEPSFDIINSAGYLISTVIDIFTRQGKEILVLDTSVNHLPEVFEYQCPPEVLGSDLINKHPYILAGATCLAGDIFGTYYFKDRLYIGDRIAFKNVGAYSLVKMHSFNGLETASTYINNIPIETAMEITE